MATVQANHADDTFLPGVGKGEPWFGEYKTGQEQINPSEFEARMLGLTINYDLDFATLTSVTSTQELTFGQTIDLTIPFAGFADLFFPETAPHSSAVLAAELGFDKVTQELRLTSSSDQQLQWILGAFYAKEEGFNIQDLQVTPSAPLYFGNFPSDYEEVSLFGNLTYEFNDQFDTSVGIRYSDYENDVQLQAIGPLLAPLALNEITDDFTSYLFNLRYRPNDQLALYARAASGYRPGGANFVLLDPTGAPLTREFFEPDTLWSYEIGAKGSLADGRLVYDLAAFYIDWEDYQIQVVRSGVAVASNAEKAVSKGLEASLSFAATDALTLRSTLSFTNAELAADAVPPTDRWCRTEVAFPLSRQTRA
ncbi:TonB-dependent receptor [Haliea sp. E1-2-M8]|uniref:TonB-dependent receptor domain-containing protein n=1 Tax=Haliea sp. E1-2-M8 TaxID=3064706 RepID=UPI0027289A9D|nr:TonB-dependent receptor [Haliea sp. E1-2-M8]MDO8863186.1 TonB-dependent receptor [Haliea sp. E1-2-M8]